MREAYLVNLSQSVTSIPLYETSPVEINGRTIQKTQYKTLVPREEFLVGVDISAEKKKYYSQFKPIMLQLKFRQAKVDPPIETPLTEEVPVVEEPVSEESEVSIEVYDEAGLMKKRQGELIKIATDLGLEASTQDSKAIITRKILEKQASE